MIVIEIRDRAVCDVYSDIDRCKVVLVDWDYINASCAEGTRYITNKQLSDMPEDTADQVSVLTTKD